MAVDNNKALFTSTKMGEDFQCFHQQTEDEKFTTHFKKLVLSDSTTKDNSKIKKATNQFHLLLTMKRLQYNINRIIEIDR